MDLRDVLRPDGILTTVRAADKRQLLIDLGDAAARLVGAKPKDVLQALLQREALGSTGIGRGIAIPHGRMPGLGRLTCLFARLEQPVAYDSADGEPVDLLFVLLSPEDAGADHLRALAKISRLMRNAPVLEMLRANKDRVTLHAILTEPDALLSKVG